MVLNLFYLGFFAQPGEKTQTKDEHLFAYIQT